MLGKFTWKVLEKDMEGLAQRFKAVSRNVANADTPGYARRNVSFEDQLRDVIQSGKKLRMTVTDPAHIPTRPLWVSDVKPVELKIRDEAYRLNGNNWGTFHGITDEPLDQPPADLAEAREQAGSAEIGRASCRERV